MEFNEIWQEARSQCPLPSLRFSGRSEIQDGSVWLRHFRLLLCNCWMEFNKIWQEARCQRHLLSLCCLGRSENQDGLPGVWLAETFFLWNHWTEFNKTWQEARSQCLLPSVLLANQKTKMAALASYWQKHFWLLWNRWSEFNETWQEARSQSPLPSLFFRADQKTKMAALASNWPRHFWLHLWNCFAEFNEPWQEASTQHHQHYQHVLHSKNRYSGAQLWLCEPLEFICSLAQYPLNHGGGNYNWRWADDHIRSEVKDQSMMISYTSSKGDVYLLSFMYKSVKLRSARILWAKCL